MHVLLVTFDQLRADCSSAAGHPVVQTPNLDRLAARGVRFAAHFSQAAPCAPGRASLYTGLYQMHHRVVANGSPLLDRFDNVARAGRRAGYAPILFGYTDQGIDPSRATSSADPWLDTYEGILPGFDVGVHLDAHQVAWVDALRSAGYEVDSAAAALASEPERPVELSLAAFMTNRALEWLDGAEGPWFVHLSYLRPHSPYAAAGDAARRFDGVAMPKPLESTGPLHPLHEVALGLDGIGAPTDPSAMAELQAQYFAMVELVDAQLGRVLDALDARGQLDETVVIVTADHGEQLGDQGLLEKLGFFESSYAIPCIVADPHRPAGHGRVVDAFTENVDVLPTLVEILGLEPSAEVDGVSLVPFLDGETPPSWRSAAHWEWDWRYLLVGEHRAGGPVNRALRRCNLVVHRTATHALVQFGDGEIRCVDLREDRSWSTLEEDPAVVKTLLAELLAWRSQNLAGPYDDLLLGPDRPGRWPSAVTGSS